MLKNKIKIALSSSLLLLAGCGGGGGSSSPAPAPAPTPVVVPTSGTDTFTPGVFQDQSVFRGMCVTPGANETTGTYVDENNWLRSLTNDTYLWYEEIVDVDPASITDTQEYFGLMKTFRVTDTGTDVDQFSFSTPTEEFRRFVETGVTAGYGVTFLITSTTPPRQLLVSTTEPNTPATTNGVDLSRGALILEVDGADLVNGNDVDTLNAGLFPENLNETHTFLIQDLNSSTTRTITMTSTEITSVPVQEVQTVATASGPVGYILFNDHIAPAEQGLVDAVNQLNELGITDLVLDLRYNGGGFLDIANSFAYMIAGPTSAGQTFEELQFNDKHPNFDPITGQSLTPLLISSVATGGFSVPQGVALPSLNLSRLFVLTGRGTCSASEAIINGLRGIDIEVIQIGDTTCGKPYGFYGLDNCGTTYLSVQFRGVNAMNFGDYSDGFSPVSATRALAGAVLPGCSIADDFTHVLGDPAEAQFAAALGYRETGVCPPSASGSRSLITGFDFSKVRGTPLKPAWQVGRIIGE